MKNSLKLKLFVTISVLVSLTLAVVGMVGFIEVREEIKEVFDADMAEEAKLILKIANHKQSQDFLSENKEIEKKIFHRFEKKIHLKVWKKNKLIHDHSADFIVKEPKNDGYQDLEINGEIWRQFSLHDEKSKLTIVVLEQFEIRHELILEILASLFIPFLFSFPIILIIVWASIKTQFGAVRDLSKEIEKISAQTLIPFAKKDLPVEIIPLINSLNIMIERLGNVLESERRFTNYAAHELRTPLATIKIQLQLLLRNKNPHKQKEYLSDLVAGIDRMTHLVNQILMLSRLEPEGNIAKESINFFGNVATILQHYEREIADKNLTINTNFAKDLEIFGNKIYLEIMMSNLLDNAVKYSLAGSAIDISAKKEKNKIKITISNLGKKIADAEIEKLFDKFYRGKNIDVIGCGLGLAIVKKIAQLHDAKIKFSSVAQKEDLAINEVSVILSS